MKEEIIISSKKENLSVVEKFIDEISAKLSIATDVYGNILLSVIEGVTNSIVHGNKEEDSKQVKISAENNNKMLLISVSDEGNGFDYTKIPNPTTVENIEKPNGRGVFLMKHLSDEIEFHKNGTVIILKFKI